MRCHHCGGENRDDARFCGGCGKAVAATEPSRSGHVPPAQVAPDLVGREIAGRYRIQAKLGEGGMGAVYRAEQISLKRRVAIKLLRPELSADGGLVRRFNAEAELAARLSHPNTVNVYDFGQDVDGTLFIAMELVEGRSLRHVITAEGPLPPRRALAIASQITASLTDAHAHGIVHRDLKPDNVMLSERGKDKDIVRVLDFGIAKLRDDQNRSTMNAMTRAGDIVGTPQYMAPEQIRGEGVDGRTDVYALGAILYEMITGRLPFEAASVMAILSRHLLDPVEPPSQRRGDLGLPPALDQLVVDALAKDPSQRTPSMERLGERIHEVSSMIAPAPSAPVSAPWSAPPPSFTPPPPSFAPAAPPPVSFVPPGPPPRDPPAMPMQGPGSYASSAQPLSPLTPPPPFAPPPSSVSPLLAPLLAPPPYAPPVAPMLAPMPTPARAPRRSARTALLASAGVLIAGGAVALVLVARKPSQEAASPGSGSDAWAAAAAPDPSYGYAPDQPSSAGETYRDPQGWAVTLPPGIPASPLHQDEDEGTMFTGMVDGRTTLIAIAAASGFQATSDGELMRGATALAENMNGTLAAYDYPTIQGQRRFRAIIDVGMMRIEAVLFQGNSTVMAMYGVPADQFDVTERLRREFFERRLALP